MDGIYRDRQDQRHRLGGSQVKICSDRKKFWFGFIQDSSQSRLFEGSNRSAQARKSCHRELGTRRTVSLSRRLLSFSIFGVTVLVLSCIQLPFVMAEDQAGRATLTQTRANGDNRRNSKTTNPATVPVARKSRSATEIESKEASRENNRLNSEVARGTASLSRFPQKSSAPGSEKQSSFNEFVLEFEDSVTPIDLPAALQLVGWKSPEVLVAQQRVLAVTAAQQLAAAQALPNLNIGMNYDKHSGALQRASGAILDVARSSLYVGAGANAVAAGTVNIPGLQYNLNVGETYFNYLASKQRTEGSQAAAAAMLNQNLLLTATAYVQLVKAQGMRAIAVKIRDDAAEVSRITAQFAAIGQGRPADAERAATELTLREADVFAADAAIIEASATLGQILNLESSIRLQSNEVWTVPRSIVPDPIPLPELIAIAMYQRPELAERRAEVHAAMLELRSAELLLFSPQFIAGFSDGVFGGGSNLIANSTGAARFGEFANRMDEDIVLYWSIRNLGCANRALINAATARLGAANFEQTQRFNEIRAEVADAYARTHARAAQLSIRHQAVVTSERGFQADLRRTRAGEGRPIEVLDNLRNYSRAMIDYLETIANYNQAHYALYVAIGQPPAGLLIHSDPPEPQEVEESK